MEPLSRLVSSRARARALELFSGLLILLSPPRIRPLRLSLEIYVQGVPTYAPIILLINGTARERPEI